MNRVIYFLLFFPLFSACEKEDYVRGYVVTREITDIVGNVAVGHGDTRIESKGSGKEVKIKGKGLIYSTEKSALYIVSHKYNGFGVYDYYYNMFRYFSYTPALNAKIVDFGYYQRDGLVGFEYITGEGEFDCYLTGLNHNTKYYVRAFAHMTNGIDDTETPNYVYGDIKEFDSGSETKDPTVFFPLNELGIGVLKEDFAGLYSVINIQHIISFSGSYYNFGNYSNWRLPTLSELLEIYKLKESIGGFGSGKYWSSSNINDTNFSLIDFSNGKYGYTSVGSDEFPISVSANIRLVRNLP